MNEQTVEITVANISGYSVVARHLAYAENVKAQS